MEKKRIKTGIAGFSLSNQKIRNTEITVNLINSFTVIFCLKTEKMQLISELMNMESNSCHLHKHCQCDIQFTKKD